MRALRSPVAISVAVLIGFGPPLRAQLPSAAPPAPAGLDVQAMQKAEAAMAQSKYDEALKLAQEIPLNYPTSPLIPGSYLVSAVCYFYLKDYDKAAEAANKNLAPNAKNVPPEILERSAILLPNILVTKGIELPDNQAQLKTRTYQDAIKSYDDFIKRFPQSEDVESALSGKGRALAMTGDFENSSKSLREALQKFPQSPTIQDTKYMLGLALAQQGMKTAEKSGGEAAKAAFDDSDKQFREIINARQDLVLMNNSYMQLGDVYSLKGAYAPKNSDEQKKFNEQALALYREVRPKEIVIQAQDARIAFWRNQIDAARQKADLAGIRRSQRVLEKETEKLEVVKGASDQSIAAKLRSVGMFLALDKYDEARVLLRFTDGYIENKPENAEDKKKVAYFLTITYAAQHNLEKAIPAYENFKATYKNDSVGENLALFMGLAHLDSDPKINNPQKALQYFDEQVKTFSTSKFSAQAIASKAKALTELGKFDEAIRSLKDLIATSKDKELLAEAEFNLAVVQRDMKAVDESLATFKAVRDKYPGTTQSEQAAFWIGQISPDAKQRVAEHNSFIEKFPKSSLVPSAYYFKAMAQNDSGDQAGAIKTFRELIEKFPDADPTPGAYFETAKILRSQADSAATKGKPDYTKVRDLLLKDFVVKFPKSDKVYASYAFSADLFSAEEKNEEAVKTYQDYIAAYPQDPNVAKAHLAIGNLYKAMAGKVGPSYLAMSKAEQEKWTAYMNEAIKNAEEGIRKFSDSDEVSRLLELLLDIDKTRLNIGLKKEEDVKSYFSQLAGKFEGTSTKPKILFALANFLADRDKAKKGGWFEIMEPAYSDGLVFSPSDIDRYGSELVKRKQLDKAKTVFAKLERDYPLPPNTEPSKVTRTVGEAQSVAMAGRASILQAEGKAAEGQALFEKLKELYPWSGKVAEAEFGIATGLYEQKKYDEASELLRSIAVKITAPVSLRAKAMMLLAKSNEAMNDYDTAINNYIKIATFFESEREIAAEGLWLGAQLQERQSKGEIPKSARPAGTPKPKATPKPAAASPKPGAATPKPPSSSAAKK
jgi:tetratricopeptide (TPR) repeat protein